MVRGGVAGCVVAVASFSRLTAWPPHEDETLALFVGRRPLGQLLDIVLEERGAPLHYLLAAVAAHSGGGLTALRLGSAAFALGSLPLVALLVARLAGRAAGLVATILVSASWVLLFHGIYGRMYSLFLCTSLLSYLALLWALDRGGAPRFAPGDSPQSRASRAIRTARWCSPRRASTCCSCGGACARRSSRSPSSGSSGLPSGSPTSGSRTASTSASRAQTAALGAPLPVLRYLKEVAGDFSSGWTILLVPILVLAAFGARELWRRNRQAAYLAACVVAVPSAAMLAARLGSGASPETRHLIFVLPFFALRAGARRPRARAEVRARGRVLRGRPLVVAQLGWAYEKTPQLFTGDPSSRVAARNAAARWLASTTRDDDVFGYEPVYLEAWERNSGVARNVIPRADASSPRRDSACASRSGAACGSSTRTTRTTARARERSRSRSGRRVRPTTTRRACSVRTFLVIRTREPTRTPAEYLDRAAQVMVVGKSLFIGDADINFVTVRRAAERLGTLDY